MTYYYSVHSHNDAGNGFKSVIVSTEGHMLPCPSHDCTRSSDAPGGGGPSAGDPVDLVTGDENYRPDPDITVYNPSGPAVVWRRSYHTYLALKGYGAPGLTPGWVHPYDFTLRAAPGAWGPLELTYPNGARETLTPELDGGGQPTGVLNGPGGSPFFVRGVPGGAAGEWQSVTVTWHDRGRWVFVPFSAGVYALGSMSGGTGQGLSFAWRAGDRALTQISDACTAAPLLSLSYASNGMLSSVTDAYNRQVTYSYAAPYSSAPGLLKSVSQVAPSGGAGPARWSYAYTSGTELLSGITVPSPAGGGDGTSAINYDSRGRVTSLVDANGNRRVYTYGTTSTQVQVKDPAGNVVQAWTQKYGAAGRSAGVIDTNNKSTSVEYNDPQNPAKPTRAVGKDGKATVYTYDQYGNCSDRDRPARRGDHLHLRLHGLPAGTAVEREGGLEARDDIRILRAERPAQERDLALADRDGDGRRLIHLRHARQRPDRHGAG